MLISDTNLTIALAVVALVVVVIFPILFRFVLGLFVVCLLLTGGLLLLAVGIVGVILFFVGRAVLRGYRERSGLGGYRQFLRAEEAHRKEMEEMRDRMGSYRGDRRF